MPRLQPILSALRADNGCSGLQTTSFNQAKFDITACFALTRLAPYGTDMQGNIIPLAPQGEGGASCCDYAKGLRDAFAQEPVEVHTKHID
jgi:hypothetical protein